MILFIAGGFVLSSVLGWICFAAENFIVKHYQARLPVDPSLNRALRQMLLDLGVKPSRLPRILIFPDPRPFAFSLRSLGSPGCFLLSQGLLLSFSDSDLLKVLSWAHTQVNTATATLATTSYYLGLCFVRWIPHLWRDWLLKNSVQTKCHAQPFSVIRFLSLFPLGHLFLKFGASSQWKNPESTLVYLFRKRYC